jgi:hypothetical protein
VEKRVFIAKAVRAAFWTALLMLLLLALAPIDVAGGFLNDKVQHTLGFYTLTVLGLASWGRRSALRLTLGLMALGAAIELLQATPLVGRDGEFMDWVADATGILLALVPAIFVGQAK